MEATHLHHPSVTFSAITKSEVINDLQTHQPSSSSPVATLIGQASSSMPSFPTMRVVRPSTIIQTTDISSGDHRFFPSPSFSLEYMYKNRIYLSNDSIFITTSSITTTCKFDDQSTYNNGNYQNFERWIVYITDFFLTVTNNSFRKHRFLMIAYDFVKFSPFSYYFSCKFKVIQL